MGDCFEKESLLENRPSVVERAFQIAKSGKVANIAALRKQFGSGVVVVTEPPPTNEGEYRRITYVNTEASIVG